MVNNNKTKDIIQGVIFILIVLAVWGWLCEKPIRWLFVVGFVGLMGWEYVDNENQRIKDLIEKTTKDCPTCEVWDGKDDYKCIYNCD
tara:strand:+ start:339 stop:599 length:261 start_codon:yes stop_codon:yes gene_type:complete